MKWIIWSGMLCLLRRNLDYFNETMQKITKEDLRMCVNPRRGINV